MKHRNMFLFLLMFLIAAVAGPQSVMAHTFTETGLELALGSEYTIEHTEDTENPGGWVNLEITNTGTEAWGDFHLYFFEVPGNDISNLHWDDGKMELGAIDGPAYDDFTFTINNDVVGATLDFYFYNNPLLPAETVFFRGYSNNQDAISFFGVAAYPTPVPLPGAALLLGSGLFAIAGVRKSLRN